MKTLFTTGVLSARQQTPIKIFNRVFRKSMLALLGMVMLVPLVSCHEKQMADQRQAAGSRPDSLAKPKIDIRVNRRYDERGSMIGFDSTYTSYYSNMSGDTAQMDSLMGSFDRYFKQQHSAFFRNQFDPLFFNDSLRYPDFFHNDYFMRRYELNDTYMRGMMQRMDSIKNSFYREHRRNGAGQDKKR